ncbi:EKC/KEOPS complex subunit TP53RK [Hetaerina americana]|uniref:EKC/KEOPS complex subunit TP53RK n=1 Tax=Hetaerina americana TaxID=62018 RepID=UPI003A7F2B43
MDLLLGYELMKQGAEAKIYLGKFLGRPAVLKERFEKKYRHPILDATITKDRIKAETRAIMRCKTAGISTPALYLADLNKRIIIMEHIKGITVKEYIKSMEPDWMEATEDARGLLKTALRQLGNDIGILVGKMHASNIIHGDLTTSNILMCADQTIGKSDGKEDALSPSKVVPRANWPRLVPIDFGLSKIDPNVEEKGVDLYVLDRALSSTHPCVGASQIFPAVLEAYKDHGGGGSKDVLSKYEDVRMRGRKRTMVG